MSFNSLGYLAFLPLVFLLYYWCAERFRIWLLVVVSVGFYAALEAPALLAALAAVAVFTWWIGRLLHAAKPEQRFWLFWGGVVVNLGILAGYKYYSFWSPLFAGNAAGQTVLVIGLSYFIFQAVSYLVDIQLEIIEPESSFPHFSLYICFFPKLLQGPIERAGDLLPQLHRPYAFSYTAVRSGLILFGWGLFKKVVIADRLALFVDPVFADVSGFSGAFLLLAVYLYALQIYFDFSGYTDMALGSARLFGINLTDNFNQPYMARSVADFWRRWHITFSRWILDYIFKPLQMGWRQWGERGTIAALFVTFLVSGIWHGTGWGFLAWGGLHGLYMGCAVLYKPRQKKLHKYFGIDKSGWMAYWQRFYTFHLVCFAWIFFRAGSLTDVGDIIHGIKSDTIRFLTTWQLDRRGWEVFFVGNNKLELLIALVVLTVALIVGHLRDRFILTEKPYWVRWGAYYLLFFSILLLGVFNRANFIYFQF